MVQLRAVLSTAAVAVLLASCGSSSSRSDRRPKGFGAPEGSCDVKPSRIGLAEKIRNIDEGNGCEVPNAWSIRSVGQVGFSQPATLNCGMAEPLREWFDGTVQPAAERSFGERVVSVDIASSYACRPRNNQRGAAR